MPTFCIRYEGSSFYEKNYEADSGEDAEEMFVMDDNKWEEGFLWSDESIIEIIEIEP
jgi:hypothetical protein